LTDALQMLSPFASPPLNIPCSVGGKWGIALIVFCGCVDTLQALSLVIGLSSMPGRCSRSPAWPDFLVVAHDSCRPWMLADETPSTWSRLPSWNDLRPFRVKITLLEVPIFCCEEIPMKEERIKKNQILDGILYVQLWCNRWEECAVVHQTGKRGLCRCYDEMRKHITSPRRRQDNTRRSDLLGVLDKNFWEDQFVNPADTTRFFGHASSGLMPSESQRTSVRPDDKPDEGPSPV